eukprot:1160303-Pelagomonas_calceolata.AAC.1
MVFEDPEEILRRSKQLLRPPKPKGGSTRSRLCSNSAAGSADEGRDTPEADDLVGRKAGSHQQEQHAGTDDPGDDPRDGRGSRSQQQEQHAGADDPRDGRGSGSQHPQPQQQPQQQQQQHRHVLPLPQLAAPGRAGGGVLPSCATACCNLPAPGQPAVHAPGGQAGSQLLFHEIASGGGSAGELPASNAAAAAAAAAAGSLSGGARADGATQAGCVSESREQLTGRDATDATPTELQQPTEQQQQQEGGEARWRASCLSELPAAPSIPIVPEPRIQARSQQVLDRLVEATEGWLLGPLEVLHAQVRQHRETWTFSNIMWNGLNVMVWVRGGAEVGQGWQRCWFALCRNQCFD